MKEVVKSTKLKTGFTLIELLVVVSIIGMLSSIVLVSLKNARDKGTVAAQIATVRQVATALELYYDDFKEYPHVTITDNGITDQISGLTAALTTGSKYISAASLVNFDATVAQYWHVCDGTKTPCSLAGQSVNSNTFIAGCGSNYLTEGVSAALIFRLKGGQSDSFRKYSTEFNTICFGK